MSVLPSFRPSVTSQRQKTLACLFWHVVTSLTSTMFWHLFTSLKSTTLIVAWRRARRCSKVGMQTKTAATTTTQQTPNNTNINTPATNHTHNTRESSRTVVVCSHSSTTYWHVWKMQSDLSVRNDVRHKKRGSLFLLITLGIEGLLLGDFSSITSWHITKALFFGGHFQKSNI